MIKITRTNKTEEQSYIYDGTNYVTIPGVIADRTDISATSKIVFGMIHSFKREWNSVSTTYIAKALGLSVRMIQHAIKQLTDAELITYYYRAKYRSYKSLLEHNKDAKVIIPSGILNMPDLSSTYKITYGMLVAAGLQELGAYNFNEISELAMHLGISISSVYRHINVLTDADLIERDESSKWMFYTLDEYSQKRREQIRLKAARIKAKFDLENQHINIDSRTNDALDALYARL